MNELFRRVSKGVCISSSYFEMPPMRRILASELLLTSVSEMSDFLLDFNAILGSLLRSTGKASWSEWRPRSEYNSERRLKSNKQGFRYLLIK